MKKNYLRNLLIFCLFYSFASLYSAQLTVNVNDCDANPAVGQVRVQNDTYNETITLVNGSAGFFIPTGVKNMIANDFSISLQPNPVHEGIVTLKVNKNLPNGSFFHFYNLAGKKLASINPEKENFIEINNAPGIIIFKFIERDNSSRWGKIVLAGNKVQINTQFNSSFSEQNYLKSALSEMSADDYLVSYIDDNGNELLSEMVNMASGADTTIYLNGCCQTLFDNQGGGNNLTGLLFDADHNLSGAIDDDKWSVIDANGKAHMFMYFANTVLAEEGDGIVLKMAYMAGNPAENSLDTLNNDTPNAFRVGLFNNNNTQLASNSGISNAGFAGYTGYYAGFAVKPTVNPQIFERKTQNSLILGDAGNLLGSGTQTGRMTSGKVQTLTFSITKTAAGMDINLTQAGDGGSSMNFTVSDNDNPETTFNSIAIGIDDDPELVGKFYFDYVTVTTCGGEVSVIPKHTLTVNNGSGSDEYVEGKSVCITANASPSGKMFDKWSGTGSAFMTDIEASSVCFAMPGIDIEVTPEYVDLPVGLVIVYDESDNLLSFAAKEITKSFVAKNMTALNCTLSVVSNTLNPDAYTLTENGENNYTVVGTDPSGAMYGGFEIAENLLIGESISTVTRTPYLPKRGIKYNIPLDARNSSYDDSGDAAQENVKNMWDLNGFWKPYLDNLAKNRYNELSLWTCHEFPHMVDFSGTEWAAVNTTYASNVYKVKKGELDANSKGKYIVSTLRADKNTWEQGSIDWAEKDVLPGGVDGDGYVDMDMLERVDGKDGIPDFSNIADKVNHWKAVFEYAEKRGITISIMHWNVYAHGAKGVAGIVESQDDLTFHRYLREAVKRLVNTYPQITTIGVAAGENDHEPEKDGSNAPDYLTERFIYLTYGLGVKDALQDEPEREVKFLWRNHSTENTDVYEQFVKDYDPGKEGLVNVSIKYTVGRLYSSRRPMEWEARAIFHGWLNDDDEEYGINVYPWKVWLNIRNDDAFMHRWGSADYVRLFIRNIPQEYCPGFLLGSDGFVFGREFIYSGTDSVLRNQLEIEKHWYNFGLWGKLAYNNELSDDYWTKVIAWKYGLTYTNAGKLFDAWENVSEIIPQIARQSYTPTDAGIQYEGCMSSWATSTGYITFDRLFLKNDANNYGRWPMQLKEDKVGGERQCWPVRNWVYYNPALTADQISPPEVAQALDDYADNGTSELATLKALNTDNAEYQDMLLDIESMAHLGRFYADKLRCAITWYKFHMAGYDPNDPLFTQAKNEIYAAKAHWEDYAAVLDQHYMPSLTARTNYLDWNGTLNNAPDRTARGKARLVKNGIAREIEAIENIEVGAGQLLELKPQPYDILWGPRWIKENGQGKIYAPWRTTDPL